MIISLYSNARNSGKKTIAMSLANEIAKQGHKTLLIDLDYLNHGLAVTYGLTHSQKNAQEYFENALRFGAFSVMPYIMKAAETETKISALKKNTEQFNENLDFLLFPQDFAADIFKTSLIADWSVDQCYEFMTRFGAELRDTNYDVVLLNLPNTIDDMFSLPSILISDVCLNIFTASVSQVEEAKKLMNAFDPTTISKIKNILTFTSKKVERAEYDALCSPLKITGIVGYDEQRMFNELNGLLGTNHIQSVTFDIMKKCGIEVQPKKRTLFR